MAVGKGSMERAAKAAGTDKAPKDTDKAKTPSKRKTTKAAPKKPVSKAPDVKEEAVVPVPEKEEQITYQKSSGMLERNAEPNEKFGLGDAMPVYYF